MSNDGGNQGTDGPAGGASAGGNYGGNRNPDQTTNIGAGSNKTNELAKEQKTKEKEFINSGKSKKKTPFFLLNLTKDITDKGSVKTRTFFTNNVLSKKGVTYKGTKYSKTEFQSLSLDKQNEIYGGYLEGRMSGATDAYGNNNPGYKQGGDGQNQVRKTEKQIETESEEEENKKEDPKTEEEKEDEYKKVKGLKGARSMFGNAGGRGYFDPVR